MKGFVPVRFFSVRAEEASKGILIKHAMDPFKKTKNNHFAPSCKTMQNRSVCGNLWGYGDYFHPTPPVRGNRKSIVQPETVSRTPDEKTYIKTNRSDRRCMKICREDEGRRMRAHGLASLGQMAGWNRLHVPEDQMYLTTYGRFINFNSLLRFLLPFPFSFLFFLFFLSNYMRSL